MLVRSIISDTFVVLIPHLAELVVQASNVRQTFPFRQEFDWQAAAEYEPDPARRRSLESLEAQVVWPGNG